MPESEQRPERAGAALCWVWKDDQHTESYAPPWLSFPKESTLGVQPTHLLLGHSPLAFQAACQGSFSLEAQPTTGQGNNSYSQF